MESIGGVIKDTITFISNLNNEFLKNDQGNLNLLGKLIKILFLFIIIKWILKLINKVVDKTFINRKGSHLFKSNRRANTLGEIVKKVLKYILYFLGIVISLEMFNINTTSILATAGIGGLAIGFGAQSLVKDVITGFFILLEDQYAVDDYVQIGDFQGVVEELGLRVTKLRDFSGELHIIPNGKIEIVTNRTRGSMRALVTIPISYEEDLDRVISILEETCKEIRTINEDIIEGPSVLGVNQLEDKGMVITIVARTKSMSQWSVERQIRKKVLDILKIENISIPYPKRIIVGGNEE